MSRGDRGGRMLFCLVECIIVIAPHRSFFSFSSFPMKVVTCKVDRVDEMSSRPFVVALPVVVPYRGTYHKVIHRRQGFFEFEPGKAWPGTPSSTTEYSGVIDFFWPNHHPILYRIFTIKAIWRLKNGPAGAKKDRALHPFKQSIYLPTYPPRSLISNLRHGDSRTNLFRSKTRIVACAPLSLEGLKSQSCSRFGIAHHRFRLVR